MGLKVEHVLRCVLGRDLGASYAFYLQSIDASASMYHWRLLHMCDVWNGWCSSQTETHISSAHMTLPVLNTHTYKYIHTYILSREFEQMWRAEYRDIIMYGSGNPVNTRHTEEYVRSSPCSYLFIFLHYNSLERTEQFPLIQTQAINSLWSLWSLVYILVFMSRCFSPQPK